MTVRVGINGFGRIGRSFERVVLDRDRADGVEVFSAHDTMANGRVVKVLGWYDNEWGYANRLVDVVDLISS